MMSDDISFLHGMNEDADAGPLVRLNVYAFSFGYHSGVEVSGQEYSFNADTGGFNRGGVWCCRPRTAPVSAGLDCVFVESIVMGRAASDKVRNPSLAAPV